MQLNLQVPIARLRREAIAQVTAWARDAHRAHEDAGGLDMSHAIDQASSVQGAASLEFHRKVQSARQRALSAIGGAEHGSAIAAIVKRFSGEIE